MAGDWIKMRADLLDDPTVDRMAELLKVDALTTVGALFCFWAWADKYSVDGHVDGATSRLVDKVSHKEGFCAAMVSVGWLVVSESGLDIPKFDRHNGQTAKERSLKNQRQARWREGKSVDAEPSTKASTREEKRREDIKPTPIAPRPSDAKPDGGKVGKINGTPADQGETVEQIPLCDGTEFPVKQSFVSELDRLYPAVEPVQTLREIRGWCLGNPSRRKTPRGVKAFITSWFSREQDKQSRGQHGRA